LTWLTARNSILNSFNHSNLRGIIEAEEVFEKVRPTQADVVDAAMVIEMNTINSVYRVSCQSALRRKGIELEAIPMNDIWPEWSEEPYNLTAANKNSLRNSLEEYSLERNRQLAGLGTKVNEFMKEFRKLNKEFDEEKKEWNEKINKCIQIWKEVLGDSVLKQVREELNNRNMPAVLNKLNELHQGVVVGDIQSAIYYDISQGIAYDPNRITFQGFIDEFNEKIALLNQVLPDEVLKMYFIQGLQRLGYNDLDESIRMSKKLKHDYEELICELIADHKELVAMEKIHANREHVHVAFEKSETGKENIQCFKCKKMGHYSNECPLLTEAEKEAKKRKRQEDKNGPAFKKQGPGNVKKPESKEIQNIWKQTANGYKVSKPFHKANVVTFSDENPDENETEVPGDCNDQESS
jgi:hypothetical protein